jgi:uracil-DNA glycosylase
LNSAEVLAAALATDGPARDILLDRARDLDLRERIIACTSCKLSGSTTPVPWEGKSTIAIIGEAPGADEARLGRPFVGRAGRLLEQVLSLAGFARSDFAFINTICCRPPGNKYDEAVAVGADYQCTPNFWEQVEFSGAWLLVPVGNQAMWKLLPDIRAGITQMRGELRWVDRYLVMPTFHPAYALRNPQARDSMVSDFIQVRRVKTGVDTAPIPKGYDPTRLLSTMRESDFTDREATSIKSMFKRKSWVFAHSTWLGETIILKRNDDTSVPPHIQGVHYTVAELARLASMKGRTWEDARRLHYAKREFSATII